MTSLIEQFGINRNEMVPVKKKKTDIPPEERDLDYFKSQLKVVVHKSKDTLHYEASIRLSTFKIPLDIQRGDATWRPLISDFEKEAIVLKMEEIREAMKASSAYEKLIFDYGLSVAVSQLEKDAARAISAFIKKQKMGASEIEISVAKSMADKAVERVRAYRSKNAPERSLGTDSYILGGEVHNEDNSPVEGHTEPLPEPSKRWEYFGTSKDKVKGRKTNKDSISLAMREIAEKKKELLDDLDDLDELNHMLFYCCNDLKIEQFEIK